MTFAQLLTGDSVFLDANTLGRLHHPAATPMPFGARWAKVELRSQ